MRGACSVSVDGTRHDIGLHDAIYVPRGSAVVVETTGQVDLVECAAEVSGNYPLQIIRYADLAADPKLQVPRRRRVDQPRSQHRHRRQRAARGGSCSASRARCRATGPAGLRTSTRRDAGGGLRLLRHAAARVRHPAGVHEPEAPEFVTIVRDGDAVLMPAGYHPNVAAPGHGINFIWMMAARREVEDRQFGVVNVQPGFGQTGSRARRRAEKMACKSSLAPHGDRDPCSASTGSLRSSPAPAPASAPRIARALAAAGADVACHGNRHAPAETAADIRKLGRRAAVLSRGLARRARPRTRWSRRRSRELGAIDILVNNAGIDPARARRRIHRRRLGRGARREPHGRVSPVPGRRPAHAGARARQDREHRFAAVVSGRHHRARVRRLQGRRRAADQGARQRVGGRAA